MTNKGLQALRKILMLNVSEASLLIAGLKSSRSWQYWEAGRYSVPDDVADAMQVLADRRLIMIAESEHLDAEAAYYLSFAKYSLTHKGSSTIDWRLSQSVAAHFFGCYNQGHPDSHKLVRSDKQQQG